MALLEADAISKSFRGRRVLATATLRAYRGSITALCGRNGTGKSTLLAIAAGWQRADTGAVHFDGMTWLRPSLPALAARGVFFLPDRAILSPGIPLGRQLDVVRRRFNSPEAVGAIAEALGISSCLEVLPPRLSGGETRRAEIALACIRQPRCLLADEPYRGISPLDADAITQALRNLSAGGCAIVISGHEIETLFAAAEAVVWCSDGSTHEYASVTAARGDWRFQREYLGEELEPPRDRDPVRSVTT